MDLVKIGKFIAELRKEQGLTQEKLGEILGVTNKTISRWETGTYLPPAEVLLDLSKRFNVSVNELLSGKKLGDDEYKDAAEENLGRTIKASAFSLKEKIEFYKKRWLKQHIAIMLLVGICIIGVFIAGFVLEKYVLVCISTVLLFIAHCMRNNAMMAYVERNAYKGIDEESRK